MSRWPGNAQRERTTFGGLSRAQLMSRVRSTGNQTTERRLAVLLRKARLSGWRRQRPILGRPDFVWPRAKVAVFVDGCFWHGHDCGKNISPKTNVRAWGEKIRRNRERDRRVNRSLREQGWRIVRIWECQLAKSAARCIDRIRRALGTGG
ncbi:MAG TPA: DNA mismatch endonuclease Vsr [Phycisphaerae bacterium]|nr:DNA mismatch endonuclease Vsr [Phycisphaerae bacterium]